MASLAEREHNFIKLGGPLSIEQAAFDLHGDSLFTSKGNSFEPEGQADIVCVEHRMICFGRCIFFFCLASMLGVKSVFFSCMREAFSHLSGTGCLAEIAGDPALISL